MTNERVEKEITKAVNEAMEKKELQFITVQWYVDTNAKIKGDVTGTARGAVLIQLLFFMMSSTVEKIIARFGDDEDMIKMLNTSMLKFVDWFLSKIGVPQKKKEE